MCRYVGVWAQYSAAIGPLEKPSREISLGKVRLVRLGWLSFLLDAVVCRFAYVSLLLQAVFGSFVPPLCVLCLQCCIGWRVSFAAEI